MDELIKTYNIEQGDQKPFFKYQLSLMKNILVFTEKFAKIVNARFIYIGLANYSPTILNHFTKRGYKWQRVNDSIEWLCYNLKY